MEDDLMSSDNEGTDETPHMVRKNLSPQELSLPSINIGDAT